MNQISFLREKVPVFRNVSEETLRGLLRAEGSRKIIYEKGDFLCRSGHELEGLLTLTAGRAQVRKGSVLLKELEAGDVTGVSALYSGDTRMDTDILARSRITALFFPREAMTEALRADPQLVSNYVIFLSTRIRFLNGVIRRFSAPDAAGRVIRYLQTEAREQGEKLRIRPTQAAAELGMGRATFYRALEQLQQEGYIRREERYVILEDPGQMPDPAGLPAAQEAEGAGGPETSEESGGKTE